MNLTKHFLISEVRSLLENMIVGISAAKVIKDWMKSVHGVQNPVADKVYLTGDKWPKMVEPLKVSAHGFRGRIWI